MSNTPNHLGYAQAKAMARKRFSNTAKWNAIKILGAIGFLMFFCAALLPPKQEPFVAMRAWIELHRVFLLAGGALIAAMPFMATFLQLYRDR